MRQIFLGLYTSAILGVAHASAPAPSGSVPVPFPHSADQPLLITAAENGSSCGSFAATSVGPVYTGHKNGYLDSYLLGIENGTLWGSDNPCATNSMWVGASFADSVLPDNGGPGHTFRNGERQKNRPLRFAILNCQASRYGAFDYISAISDSYSDLDYGRSARANPANAAPAPEIQIYAMLLAGLGLVVLSARRRWSDPFD